MKKIPLLLLLLTLLDLTSSNLYSQQPWTKVPNELEYSEVSLSEGTTLGKQLFVARISLIRHGIKILRAQDFGKKSMTAKEICIASGALLCINASFFDEKDMPLGLLISSGISFQRPHLGGDTLTGIFASLRKTFSIVGRNDLNTTLFIEAVQAGPRLVINAEKVSDVKDQEVSRRSGICLDQNGAPVFFVSAIDSRAISLGELADAMLNSKVLCKDGLNLDGGGSAQLFMRTENSKTILPNETIFDIRGEDEAPVFLGVVEGLRF